MTTPVGLTVQEGNAAKFHEPVTGPITTPEVRHFRLTSAAVVLGSTQRSDVVDREACAAAGVEVVRRRSGGGAVLLRPAEIGWLDVLLPRGAPGWSDDIHAPMVWIGRHLAAVLAEGLPAGHLTVHDGPLETTSWSSTVCFDGVGAGEILCGAAKVVGISQRRTRELARLQCLWYTHHDVAALVSLLRPPRPEPDQLRAVATVPAALSAAVPEQLAARLRG